jgi:N-acyl homoserine lactone hydrolase
VGLREALAAIGAQIWDIRLAANCHLHFDHCGGNPLLGQSPVFVQDIELGTARQAPEYTARAHRRQPARTSDRPG